MVTKIFIENFPSKIFHAIFIFRAHATSLTGQQRVHTSSICPLFLLWTRPRWTSIQLCTLLWTCQSNLSSLSSAAGSKKLLESDIKNIFKSKVIEEKLKFNKKCLRRIRFFRDLHPHLLTITLILSTKMYFSPLQSCRTRPGTTRTSTWTSSSTSTRTSRPTTSHHHHKCLLPWMCKPLHLHNYLLPWMCLVLSLTGPGLATHHHVLTPEISSKFPQDPRISRTKLSKVEFLKCNIIFSILTGARHSM